MKLSRAILLQSLFFIVIVLGVYFSFADFARLKLNTADASTYLNIAENIASHKGFVVSFNLYQSFTSHYYPIWPYIQSIYPILCSFVFMAHGGIEQVIKMNIFILGLNAALIFYIILVFVPSRLNALFLIWLVFSFDFFYSAMFAWTEQLYLLLFLISFILFLRYSNSSRGLLWIGVLNGVLFLVRVAHAYSFMAYVVLIFLAEGSFSQRSKNALILAGGFLLIVGAYQLFNYLVYHSFYPQYIKPAVDYTQARILGVSTYREGYTGLYDPFSQRSSFAHLGYFYRHIGQFFGQVYLFFIPVLAYLSLSHHKKEGSNFVLNCLCQSIFIIMGYCYSFSWDFSIEVLRYSLVPFILIALAGWFCIYELFLASGVKWRELCAAVFIANLAIFSVCHYFGIRRQLMTQSRDKNPYYINLYESYSWIDQNLPKEVLVASDEDQEGYFMHRPFISMPPGRSFNCTNLSMYNRIYSPDYYLLSTVVTDKCFASIPHTTIFSNKTFRLFKVVK